ncbi:MAG: hypothetical protein IJA51_04215 [Oscillospiraceae bacterium]|nr:hypothetical protein [Oscillospiraceae bacterium]
MEIKEKIEELWEKITADDGILEQFKEEPVKTVEELLGIDLPDEKIKEIAAAIKAKINMEKIDDALDSLKEKVDLDQIDEKLDVLADKLEDKLEGFFGRK